MLAIDPHHSEYSSDGTVPAELILDHAADLSLDGVVVTDHDTTEGSIRAPEIAPEYGLVGIPGDEVSTGPVTLTPPRRTCPPSDLAPRRCDDRNSGDSSPRPPQTYDPEPTLFP